MGRLVLCGYHQRKREEGDGARGAKGGGRRLPAGTGKGLLGDEVRECWEGESWTSRQERVSGAVSAGCVARGTARAGEALRCYGPGAVWLQDEQRRHGPWPSRICHPRAETDMNQATAGTHGCVQTTWQLSKSQGPPGECGKESFFRMDWRGGAVCVKEECPDRASGQSKASEAGRNGEN